MNPKQVRTEAGLSLAHAAAFAGVNEATAKVYELSREAVSPRSRAVLDGFYTDLANRNAIRNQ